MSTAKKFEPHVSEVPPQTQQQPAQDNVHWAKKTELFFAVTGILSLLTYIPMIFPISLIRLAFYGGVAWACYSRTKNVKYTLFTVAAAFVDVVPGLSLIPFVPSILNFTGIGLSFYKYKNK